VTAGQRVRVSLCVPSKEWTGEATVARVQRRFTGSGFEMSAIGLRFESEDQITDLEAYQITAAA
jgi:hypothetical protein